MKDGPLPVGTRAASKLLPFFQAKQNGALHPNPLPWVTDSLPSNDEGVAVGCCRLQVMVTLRCLFCDRYHPSAISLSALPAAQSSRCLSPLSICCHMHIFLTGGHITIFHYPIPPYVSRRETRQHLNLGIHSTSSSIYRVTLDTPGEGWRRNPERTKGHSIFRGGAKKLHQPKLCEARWT